MLNFVENKDYIWIPNTLDFDIKQTLECGQVFRYKKQDFGYTVYSLDHKADIYCQNDGIKIFTKDIKYFINYFDFYTNYDKIKLDLSAFEELQNAIKYGSGIRILKSNPLEMIIEFIISQNNNIPRIKSIIEKICIEYGKKCDDFYAFPTLETLKKIPIEFFKNIKCGYRDKYLFDTIHMLSYDFINSIYNMDTNNARKQLMKLKGVGRKVADCILLFGYSKTDVFPTDTWVVQAYNKMNDGKLKSADEISKYFVDVYGNLSGYAQQYIYYQMREGN